MSILVTSTTSTIPGPETRINCSKCGPNVPAVSYRLEERMGVFFIPLLTQRETYLKCPNCGTARLTNLSFDELAACPPDELEHHIYQRISIIIKVIAVASPLLFCVPLLGLVLGIIGFVASRRAGGWIKVVSLVGIVLGALANLAMIVQSWS